MNRFRSRKKSYGEGTDGNQRPSLDSDVPTMPSLSSKTFRRKKKHQQEKEPEPKPELDLGEVLPTSDDFRTSLLMPGLSARFSMLREQDDPNSKIGKANDDSVLFPKRESRLDLFNSRVGLSDIAEVDSIRAGSLPRPQFASIRTDSYGSDGYGTDEGSVMSRARPGEGNTMFGGRQKIYKIPVGQAGSAKNFGSNEETDTATRGGMGGKAIYESDAFPSAFQIAREQERERERELQQERDAAGENGITRSSREQDRSGSPPYPRYNRNRETTSSTNSGPSQSRASTAATSIASQKSVYGAHDAFNGMGHGTNSERPVPKGKKLYGQGLDQHHLEQPSSPLQRINSFSRQRGGIGKSLSQSRSATNLNDRFQRSGPVYTSTGFRAASPSPSPTPPRMQEFDLGLSNDSAVNSQPDSGHGTSPTVSPIASPNLGPVHADATLVAALEPNDIGKATASGAFNKPQKQYNEQQYLQRQLQLQEGRNTPSPGPHRPFSPPNASIYDPTTGRSRNNSQGSQFSRTGSMRHVWEHHMDDRVLRSVPERTRSPSINNSIRTGSEDQVGTPDERTFFGGTSGSEIGSNPESESEADAHSPKPSTGNFQGFRQPAPPPVSETRPAQMPNGFNFDLNHDRAPSDAVEDVTSDSRSYLSEKTVTSQPHQEQKARDSGQPKQLDPDSPVLGDAGISHNLSGLVKQHLRNESGTSSVYPEDSPRRSRPEARESIFGHASALNQQDSWREEVSHDDHWRDQDREGDQGIPPVPQGLSLAARHMLEQANAIRNQDNSKANVILGNDKAQRILGGEAPRPSHETNTPWQEQLRAHHTRVGSTETEREREGLARELEARKRMVMNNLQPFAEGGSRDASPAGIRNEGTIKTSSSFGLLRKSSSTAMNEKAEKPSKAMKMLGLESRNAQASEQTSGLFMARDQHLERARPADQNGLKPRSSDPATNSDGSPSKNKRSFFGSRNHQSSQRPSPNSSRSGSGGSDRRPTSRKDNTSRQGQGKGDAMTIQQEGFFDSVTNGTNDANGLPRSREGPGVYTSNEMSLPGTPPALAARSGSNSNPGTPMMIHPANRQNASPFSYDAHSQALTKPNDQQYSMTHPTMINPQRSHTSNGSQNSPKHNHSRRHNSINKQDISEPTFISSTSTFDTVDLPPGASLRNGMDEVSQMSAPPIPARDSRRKRTHQFFQNLGSRSERRPGSPTISSPIRMHSFNDNDSPFDGRIRSPVDDVDGARLNPPHPTYHLRRTSSDGSNVRVRPRHHPIPEMGPIVSSSPPKPASETHGEPSMSVAEQHLPYQAKTDVPASAVMF